jgi:hypothetical protein
MAPASPRCPGTRPDAAASQRWIRLTKLVGCLSAAVEAWADADGAIDLPALLDQAMNVHGRR